MFIGATSKKKIQNALKRLLAKVKHESVNSLEITGIVARRFLGVPCITVSAHSRHIQQSCYLAGTKDRRAPQRDAELAKG